MKRIFAVTISLCLLIGSLLSSCVCYADSAKPLFVFDYEGSHIETYGTYSIIDGKVCSTHRYFVQSGNLVLIDQNLQPTERGVFIYFQDGKSYIAVLSKNGKLISLGTEDLCTQLEDFRNRSIASIADNIGSSSTTLCITYNDGSSVSYDCVSGKVISRTAAREQKSVSDFLTDFIADMFDRSTQGMADISGATAQSIVITLENSGVSLEQLIDSGIIDEIRRDFSDDKQSQEDGEIPKAKDYSDKVLEYAESIGLEIEGQGKDDPKTGDDPKKEESKDPGSYANYDYTKDPDYMNLMRSYQGELTKEQVEELRKLFAKIAAGEITARDAGGVLSYTPGKDNEQGGSKGGKEKITLGSLDIKIKTDISETFKKVEKNRTEKKFISGKKKESYLAVYNAEENRYEIFAQGTILENPDELTSENSKLPGSGKIDNLNNLLAGKKGGDLRSGMRLFILTSAAILVAVAAILAFAARSVRTKAKAKNVKA